MTAAAFLIALSLASGQGAYEGRPDRDSGEAGLAFAYRGVLKVDDAEAALKSLIAAADTAGGYFANKSRERMDLRIPAAKAQGFWERISKYGMVAEQNLETENLASYISELSGRIAAKRKVLEQYFALLQTASDTTLFEIEGTISGLQQEIDAATGEKNLAEDRVEFARMSIDFTFHDRTAPLPTGDTRFPWLNSLGLQNLLHRFGYGKSAHE